MGAKLVRAVHFTINRDLMTPCKLEVGLMGLYHHNIIQGWKSCQVAYILLNF